jgi:hypothetical protein
MLLLPVSVTAQKLEEGEEETKKLSGLAAWPERTERSLSV